MEIDFMVEFTCVFLVIASYPVGLISIKLFSGSCMVRCKIAKDDIELW
jgi:hypothetical protein